MPNGDAMREDGQVGVLPQGLDGFVVRFGDRVTEPANRAALAFREALEREGWTGVEETSPALVSVFVRFDPRAVAHDAMAARLDALLRARDWTAAELGRRRRLWRIPTVYGGAEGPQLAEAAEMAGLDAAAAVRELSSARLRVLAIGFAPGQPYLGELPERWAIPRQTGLTPEVPEGAMTVAVRQVVLFANPSPTGWRWVGRTAFRCFRPEAAEPFPLRPGDEVVFEAVAPEAMARLRAEDAAGGGAAAVAL
jgi:KipI family sensor histidine kinase inhibitor